MNSLITNYIYTNFIVGSNKQQMEMSIRTQDSSTFLVSDSCRDNTLAVKFSESQSESYREKSSQKYYLMYEYRAAASADDFIILQNNNKQTEINDYEFMLVSSLWDSYQEYLGGMIGLQFQKKEITGDIEIPENTDFIYQLKENNLINSKVFALIYEDDFNGKLYIGDYFHEFNESYNESNLISTRAGHEGSRDNLWEINVDQILSGDSIIFDTKTYFIICYEYGILAAPEYYQTEIESSFFNDYYAKGICELIERRGDKTLVAFKKYKYIVCDKNNFNKRAFPELSFYNSELNMSFSLSHEDLFYEYEDKIYCLIVFPIYGIDVKFWYIGKPFIKKYKLFLDEDKKTIGLYFNREEKKEEQEQEKEKELEKEPEKEPEKDKDDEDTNKYKIILIVFGVALIIAISALLLYLLVYKKFKRTKENKQEDINTVVIEYSDNKTETKSKNKSVNKSENTTENYSEKNLKEQAEINSKRRSLKNN